MCRSRLINWSCYVEVEYSIQPSVMSKSGMRFSSGIRFSPVTSKSSLHFSTAMTKSSIWFIPVMLKSTIRFSRVTSKSSILFNAVMSKSINTFQLYYVEVECSECITLITTEEVELRFTVILKKCGPIIPTSTCYRLGSITFCFIIPVRVFSPPQQVW